MMVGEAIADPITALEPDERQSFSFTLRFSVYQRRLCLLLYPPAQVTQTVKNVKKVTFHNWPLKSGAII